MNARARAATFDLLHAGSIDEAHRRLVTLAAEIGFQRAAVLAVSGPNEAARVLCAAGAAVNLNLPLPSEQPAQAAHVRSYVFAPIRERERVAALLYADGLPEDLDAEDSAQDLAFAIELASLVHANLALSSEVAALARTDALTSLPNARVFEERLQQELQRSARSRRSFALALLSLDEPDSLPAGHGGHVPDAAVQGFSQAIRSHARHVDFAARLQGAEFAMILVDVDRAAAEAIVARLLQAVRVSASDTQRVSGSAGVALSYPVDTIETIKERADAALYEAKAAGSGHARFT